MIYFKQAYLFTSQTLEVLSMEQDAKKSPQECQEHPHTAWVWSAKVRIHSALEKSQIFTVPSPDDVARRAPLLGNNIFFNILFTILFESGDGKMLPNSKCNEGYYGRNFVV